MFEPQQRVGVNRRLAAHRGRRLADHVAAQQNVADQRAFRRVSGAFRPLLHFTQLSDVVQNSARDDKILVQRRLHLGIVVGIFVGQKKRKFE